MTTDDSQSLQFCLQQVDQELQPLQHRQSKMPSLPMDEFTFQLSPRNEQEPDDPFHVNLFLSPSDRGFSELKGSLSISRHPSLSFATNYEKPEAAHGPLSSGWIRNVTASVVPSNNEQPCTVNAKLPFSGANSTPMFDTPFIPCATDTDSDGNPYSGSMSDLSSFDDSIHKKQSTKNRKKWICSNCRYYNNLSLLSVFIFFLETKRCLNCGNPSPYHSQHSKDYPNSPVPSMEVMNQLALNSNQINLDIDVGGGYTLRDFPFAYLPSIPSGDSSEAALKLVKMNF